MRILITLLITGCSSFQLGDCIDVKDKSGNEFVACWSDGGIEIAQADLSTTPDLALLSAAHSAMLVLGDSRSQGGSGNEVCALDSFDCTDAGLTTPTPGAWKPSFVAYMRSHGPPDYLTVGRYCDIYAPLPAQCACAVSGERIANIDYLDGRSNPIAACGWDVAEPLDTPGNVTGGYDDSSCSHIDVELPAFVGDGVDVFVNLGANDIANAIVLPSGDPTMAAARLGLLVDHIKALAPASSRVFIGSIDGVGSVYGSTVATNITAFNAALPAIASAHGAIFCDAAAGFDPATMLQPDQLHENADGMAHYGAAVGACVTTQP